MNFPLLNCVEKSEQSDLCRVFPQLYDDLCDGKVSTLADFMVEHKHFQVADVESELEKLILKKMCSHSAKVIKLQCGREYFPDNTDPTRGATVIHELTQQEREGLPTNNLKPERALSHFDRMAVSASCRNSKFRAKDIRKNMAMLFRTSDLTLTKAAVKSSAELEARERMWREEQLQLKSVNDQKKKNKAQQTKLYQRKVLQTVKSWGGPCTTVDELNRALQKDGFDEETIVIQELINFRLSNSNTISPQDRPLLKIRKIPHATRYISSLIARRNTRMRGDKLAVYRLTEMLWLYSATILAMRKLMRN